MPIQLETARGGDRTRDPRVLQRNFHSVFTPGHWSPPLIRCPLSALTPKPRISAAFTLSSPPGRLTIPVARAAHAPSPRNSGQVLALRRELKLTRRRVASQQRHIAELRARYDDYDQKLQTTSHKLNAVLQELSRCKTELQYWRSKSPAVTSCSCGKTTPTPLHEPPHFGDAPDQPALPLEGVDFTPIDAQEACASTSVALGELAATAGRRVQSPVCSGLKVATADWAEALFRDGPFRSGSPCQQHVSKDPLANVLLAKRLNYSRRFVWLVFRRPNKMPVN